MTCQQHIQQKIKKQKKLFKIEMQVEIMTSK